ncbi:MAG: phosphoribosylglycinamide formyltransferase [Planctomycetes bacterium]|nr:phosphoribosylglycinamide formyltransferase [Planctomycetota bacterium]
MTKLSNIEPVRLVALISGGGRTLMNFMDKIRSGELAARVVGVVASGHSPGVERARQAGLEVCVVPRKDYDSVKLFSTAVNEAVLAAGPDVVALAGFLHLWHYPESLDWKVMNIHPALLPSFGGAGMYGHHVHEAVLEAGCKVTGCTVHFCDRRYDTGPIIVQRTVAVLEGDTPNTLAARVFEQECIAYPEAINLFAEDRLSIDGRVVHVRAK